MTRFSMSTASRKRIFRRGAKRERGVWLFGGDYSISRTDTLLFVFRWLLLASVLKAFLSIKYTALLSFLFSCVSFFLFYLSIYQLVHTPFLSPPSLPYPIPSSSDFFLFFFFSSLPSYLLPSIYPAILFFDPPHFSMDDSQTAFATQYPPYGFDLDMMKVCTIFFSIITITHLCSTPSVPWIRSVVPTPKRLAGRPTRLAHPPLTVLSHLLPAMLLRITAMAPRQAFLKVFRTVLPLQPLQALFILLLSIRQLQRCPDRLAPALQMHLCSSNIKLSNSNSRLNSSRPNSSNNSNSN